MIERVRPYTKSNRERIQSMIDALKRIEEEHIAGDVVECGVWRAGNIILARILAPGRTCWLYDTFAGMTKPGDRDAKMWNVKKKRPGTKAIDIWSRKKEPWAACSVEEVRQNFLDWGIDPDPMKFVKGPVEETLLDEDNLPDQIALLRLDTDWYESTKIELEVLYPRLVSGGILIVDDYGHWVGARQAVDDYLGSRVEYLKTIDYTGVQMVKP